MHKEGDISEATKYYQQLISQGCNDHRVFSNYGLILKSLGKLKEAEISTRKALEINLDYDTAHSYLVNILLDYGKLKELIIFSKIDT